MRNILRLFFPFEDGEGEGEGEGNQHAEGEGGKPEWLPDKFYDPDAGPLVETMAKSYTEMEGKLRSKEDDIRESVIADMKANTPENYDLVDLTKVDGFEVPEGVELNLTNEDPMISWFFEAAKGWGLSQDQVNEAIQGYVKTELSSIPSMDDEIKLLGDHGQDRLLRVHTALQDRLEDSEFDALKPMLGSAQSIAALEKLLTKASPGSFDGEGGGQAMTLDEIRKMQDHPDYWQDPVMQKKVADAYQRLYKNG